MNSSLDFFQKGSTNPFPEYKDLLRVKTDLYWFRTCTMSAISDRSFTRESLLYRGPAFYFCLENRLATTLPTANISLSVFFGIMCNSYIKMDETNLILKLSDFLLRKDDVTREPGAGHLACGRLKM